MLDAAVEVFSSHGYHATSMDEIAERAQVSKPLLYLYLGSKEETFGACIAREAARLVDAIAVADSAPADQPGERLALGLRAFFSYVAEHRGSWVVLYQQARSLSGPVAEQLVRARAAIVDTVTELVWQSLEEGSGRSRSRYAERGREAAAIAHALVGAADALADWALTVPGERPETTARRLVNLIWVGLERRAGGEGHPPRPPRM